MSSIEMISHMSESQEPSGCFQSRNTEDTVVE